MRKTSNPNVIHPDDLYTKAERIRFQDMADLEEQIDAIGRELDRLNEECNAADMAGDWRQVSAIESRAELLIELQCELQLELNSLSNPD
jgi:hypothetical protein